MSFRQHYPRVHWALTRLLAVLLLSAAVCFPQWWMDRHRQREEAAALQLDRQLGVTAETLDRDAAVDLQLPENVEGVVVTSLSASGAAARAGVVADDVVERIGTATVWDNKSAARALRTDKELHPRLLLNRHGTELTVVLDRP